MNKKITEYFTILIPVICSFLIALLIVKGNSINNVILFDNSFVVNIIVVILGFTVTIITFLYTGYEKLIDVFKSYNVSETENKVSGISDEIKENVYCIFVILIIILALISFEQVDIPLIVYPDKWSLSKIELFATLKLTVFIIVFYAFGDILRSIMRMLDIISYKK